MRQRWVRAETGVEIGIGIGIGIGIALEMVVAIARLTVEWQLALIEDEMQDPDERGEGFAGMAGGWAAIQKKKHVNNEG